MSRVFLAVFFFMCICVYVNSFAVTSALLRKPVKFGSTAIFSSSDLGEDDGDSNGDVGGMEEPELTSKEMARLQRRIEETTKSLAEVRELIAVENEDLKLLDDEFGEEIRRINKEFSRMKERSIEEAVFESQKARADALKEILPITDNYFRAKAVFDPLESENDKAIAAAYDDVFDKFQKVIEDFGVKRVIAVGQPFDPNFHEAIMTAPSTEYEKDIVCQEFQVGYKMGDRSIRPSMVVVSTGA